MEKIVISKVPAPGPSTHLTELYLDDDLLDTDQSSRAYFSLKVSFLADWLAASWKNIWGEWDFQICDTDDDIRSFVIRDRIEELRESFTCCYWRKLHQQQPSPQSPLQQLQVLTYLTQQYPLLMANEMKKV